MTIKVSRYLTKILCLESKPSLLNDKLDNFLQISRADNAPHPSTLAIMNKVLAVNFDDENNFVVTISGSEKRPNLSTDTIGADKISDLSVFAPLRITAEILIFIRPTDGRFYLFI